MPTASSIDARIRLVTQTAALTAALTSPYVLTGTDSVKLGKFAHPATTALAFVAIDAENEVRDQPPGGIPLNQYQYVLRLNVSGWAPVTSASAGNRLASASALWHAIASAISADYTTAGGSSSLFAILSRSPEFDCNIQTGSVHKGTDYGRFEAVITYTYRKVVS